MNRFDVDQDVYKARKLNSRVAAPTEKYPTDRIVERVRAQLLHRSKVGFKKYGVTLERDDLSTLQWIDHAIEESLDHALYLTRLKEELS